MIINRELNDLKQFLNQDGTIEDLKWFHKACEEDQCHEYCLIINQAIHETNLFKHQNQNFNYNNQFINLP